IRDVQPEDAEAIIGIFNPIIESGLYTAFDTPFTSEEERAYIQQFPERGIFHIAVRQAGGRVVGFQSMEPFASFTQAFDHVGVIGTYVDLACRRQGIASDLFAATFDAARRKGYEKLFTYIRADNPAALATYLKHGFQIVGRAEKQARIRQRYIDEIIVEKFL
ncbi:MAG: GNAT family N-acetyltransferase, partial [Blastocatellia bacterium]